MSSVSATGNGDQDSSAPECHHKKTQVGSEGDGSGDLKFLHSGFCL